MKFLDILHAVLLASFGSASAQEAFQLVESICELTNMRTQGHHFRIHLAAIVLLGALIPTTLVGHAFWKEEEQAKLQNQLTQFYKNLGLVGGLLLVLAEKD